VNLRVYPLLSADPQGQWVCILYVKLFKKLDTTAEAIIYVEDFMETFVKAPQDIALGY